MQFHVEEKRSKRWVHIASFETLDHARWFAENVVIGTPLRVVESWPRRRVVNEYAGKLKA